MYIIIYIIQDHAWKGENSNYFYLGNFGVENKNIHRDDLNIYMVQ